MVIHRVPFRLPSRVFQNPDVNPSEQRSFSYSQDMRRLAISLRLQGLDGNDNVTLNNLRQNNLYPKVSTVDKWMLLYNQFGHSRPFRRTGNRRAQREIRGRNLVLLALYRAALPKATIAEVNAFLFVMNTDDPNNEIHSYSQICRGEKSILISRKRSSTTAFQAMLPINIERRNNFWSLPYPHGIVGIHPNDMIDIDEAGVYPSETNRHYGKTTVGTRAREVGTYGRNEKLNVLLAISGEDGPQGGQRWLETWDHEGTTNERFYNFIERIINEIGEGTEERRRCFTMDNLNAHLNPTVYALIINSGHRIMFRAPYYPIDGPIEYVFNTVQNLLCIFMREIVDMDSLRLKVEQIIGAIPQFSNYFRHVGFQYND